VRAAEEAEWVSNDLVRFGYLPPQFDQHPTPISHPMSGGTLCTLTGAHFGADTSKVLLIFNETKVLVKSVTHHALHFVVPSGRGRYPWVSIDVDGQSTLQVLTFEYQDGAPAQPPAPTIRNITATTVEVSVPVSTLHRLGLPVKFAWQYLHQNGSGVLSAWHDWITAGAHVSAPFKFIPAHFYAFRVAAVDEGNNFGLFSASSFMQLPNQRRAPSQMQPPLVSLLTASTVSVQWEAPQDWARGQAQHPSSFHLQYSLYPDDDALRVPWQSVPSFGADLRQAIVTAIDAHATVWRIAASNDAGMSSYSRTSRAVSLAARRLAAASDGSGVTEAMHPDRPPAIYEITIFDLNASSVNLSLWINDAGLPAATELEIESRACRYIYDPNCADSDAWSKSLHLQNQTTLFAAYNSSWQQMTGLQPGLNYSFRARVGNSVGWSSWAEAAAVKLPADVPFSVPDVHAVSIPGTIRDFNVSFGVPYDGGFPILFYLVYYASSVVANTTTTAALVSVPQSLPSSAIKPSAFTVSASSILGEGAPSVAARILEARAVPSPPTSLQPILQTNSTITLAWNLSSSDGSVPVAYQELELALPGAMEEPKGWKLVERLGAAVDEYVVVGLFGGTQYQFRVVAVNEIGRSLPAVSNVIATDKSAPSLPINLRTIGPTLQIDHQYSLTVQWDVAHIGCTAQDACKIYFEIWQCSQSNCTSIPELARVVSMSATVMSLKRGDIVTLRIRAVNEIGVSEWAATPPMFIDTLAAAPAHVIVVGHSATTLQLRWELPAGIDVLQIIALDLQHRTKNASAWIVSQVDGSLPASNSTVVVTGLSTGEFYQFR
jgi:hypothetical protein